MSKTRGGLIRCLAAAFVMAVVASGCSDDRPPATPAPALGTAAQASREEVPDVPQAPPGRRCAGGDGERSALDFATNRLFTTGSDPFSVVIADFNHDGKGDLAVANNGDDTVAVLLGNGDGSFQRARAFALPAGAQPFAVAVGDFNHDREPDLAVTDNGTGEVTVLLGDGHGGFARTMSVLAVAGPGPIAVADFDHDGSDDIVVLSTSIGQGSVLLGDGHGNFGAPHLFAAPIQPSSLFFPLTGTGTFAVGDFNRDHHLDLAIADTANNQVDVLFGDGHGGFQSTQTVVSVGQQPSSVAAADFDGDGNLDLAVTNAGDESLTVLVGDGHGGFQTASNPAPGGLQPLVLAVGDFNGDGKPDLAVEILFSDQGTSYRNLSVLLGNGNGTFQAPAHYAATWAPNAVAVGKVDGDERLDIVSTDSYTGAARVLLGNGDGTFRDALETQTGTFAYFVAEGDFNHDRKPDLAVIDFNSSVVSILLGNGDGTFTLEQTIAVPFGQGFDALAVGDLDHDGNLDIVATSTGVSVLLGNGDGTFVLLPTVFLEGSNPSALLIADFNLDHNPDIAVIGNDVTVLLGNGDRSNLDFEPVLPGNPAGAGTAAVVGDFNCDGKPDLAVVPDSILGLAAGGVTVLLGDGTGSFSSAQTFATGSTSTSVATGDLDGDGVLDLAVADFGSDEVSVLVGKGDGTFHPAASFAAGTGPTTVVIADFDGDGRLDLAVSNSYSQSALDPTAVEQTEVNVLLGKGHGRRVDFQPSQRFGAGLATIGLAVGDFDLDGRLDLAATVNPSFIGFPGSGVDVLLNRSR